VHEKSNRAADYIQQMARALARETSYVGEDFGDSLPQANVGSGHSFRTLTRSNEAEMRFKLLINPMLLMIVIGAVLTWLYKPSNPTAAQQPERVDGTVKVVLKQLPVQDHVIPVEIILPVATSSAPNVLDDVTYFVKNNSGKAISAVAVTKKILYREDGKVRSLVRCSTADFSFHPDFPSKPLASGLKNRWKRPDQPALWGWDCYCECYLEH